MRTTEKSGWDSIGGALSTSQFNWVNDPAHSARAAAQDCFWYAIQTRVRFEKKVASQLERKGIEVFLPLLKQVHRWSDRRQTIEVPLFPGYEFVQLHIERGARLQVLQTAGLVGFVSFNGEAIPIPRKQIEDIQQILGRDVPCAMYPFLKPGRKVRIRGGCLDGLEGVMAERDSDKKLFISIEAIQRTLAVQVEGYDIEPV